MVSRRGLLGGAAGLAGGAALAGTATAQNSPATSTTGLKSLTASAKPITRAERLARLDKARRLMGEQGIGALIVEPGAALDYFTGVQWWRSERVTCAVIPARGETVIVTPAFEEPSVRESLGVPAEVRVWQEDESPYRRVAQALADRGAASGKVAVEATVRFFVVDGVRREAPGAQIVSGDPVTRPCRMIKSPAELALMQVANDVTLAAIRHLHATVRAGMTAPEIDAMLTQATRALGGETDGGLVLLNEASAYPHGSKQPQAVREGSVILIDTGCSVHGYQSDISRTWVYGQPSKRQREVWDTVKRGQEIVLETARPGARAGDVDRAVRAFYEREGWGPGYRLPGTPHRAGHGIGMEGHEPAYFVGNDDTRLQPGMCFSDEPGLYIPGQFGVRMEDCLHITEAGPKLFTGLAPSIDDPI